ncbi:uncharacterized protein PHA67_023605 isoform 7-T7 [Liasis olivaceus]
MTQSCSLIPECKKGNKFLLSYRKAVRVARWLRWWSSLCWMCSGRPPVWDALIWIYWWAGRGMLDLMPSGTFLMLRCPLPGLSASFLGLGLGVHLSGGPLPQLRPLFLLSLADFLGAAVLISTMAVHLLPSQLFGAAYGFCLYGLMFGMMFYAISLLMVLVYACEVNRAVRGWRVTQHSNLQLPGSHPPFPGHLLEASVSWFWSCGPGRQRARPFSLPPALGQGKQHRLPCVCGLGCVRVHGSVLQSEQLAPPGLLCATERWPCPQKPRHPPLPAGPCALLDASLPPRAAVIHQPPALLPFPCLGGNGLPAQPRLRLAAGELPPGAGRRAATPALFSGPEGLLRGLPGRALLVAEASPGRAGPQEAVEQRARLAK